MTLLGEAPRDLRLGSGRAAWGRSALGAGLGYRFRPARFVLDVRAEALLALLYVQGRGFDQTSRSFDVDAGLGCAARGGVQLGAVQPFVSVELAGWLRPEQAIARQGGAMVSANLPRIEVLLALGLAFASRR
jgi:hypothetical protein